MVQIVPKHVAVTNSVTIYVMLTCVLLDNKDTDNKYTDNKDTDNKDR